MVETSFMSLHGCALASKPKPPGQLPDSRTCVAAFISFLNVTNNHRLRYLRTPAIATVRTKNMHLSQWMLCWCLFVLYPAESCRFHMQPNNISFSLPWCPCRHCPKTPECHVSLQIQAVDWENTPRICRQKTHIIFFEASEMFSTRNEPQVWSDLVCNPRTSRAFQETNNLLHDLIGTKSGVAGAEWIALWFKASAAGW